MSRQHPAKDSRKQQLAIIISCLFIAATAGAQTNLCKSSFHFTPASSSSIPITPTGPATYSQLYNVNGFTWEAWFRVATTNLNNQLIIGVEDAVAFQDIFLGFGYGPSSSALNFHITDNGAFNTVVDAQSSQVLTPGTWYHVAGVCDYANAQLRLYLNGNLVATTTIPATVLQNRLTQDHTTFIGNASASLSALDGDIDEVRFWNTVRTQTQIQQNSAICMTLPQPGLVAYFKADETTGTSTKSAVNNDYQATLQNATWSTQYPGPNCYSIDYTDKLTGCKTTELTGTVTNSIPVTTWAWNFGDGNTGSGQTGQHTYAATGTKNVKLVLTDNAGCKDSLTKQVDIQTFTYNVSKDTTICSGQSYKGYTATGIYTDNISSVAGCDTIRTIKLTVNPKPNIGNDAAASMCEGTTIDLTSLYNTSTYPTVIWNTPAPTNVGAGTYTLQVASAAGCRDTAQAVIKTNPFTRTTISVKLCEGEIYAGHQTAGTYIDTFTVAGACDSIRTLNLTVIPCKLTFPTAITPNGDNKNDLFKALNTQSIKNYHLAVYNRWGQKVFETNNAQQGWDGKVNGKSAGTEAYIWYCEFIQNGQTKKTSMKGVVTLVK